MDTRELTDKPWVLLPGTLCTNFVFGGLMDALRVEPAQRHYIHLDRPSIEDYAHDFETIPKNAIVCGFSLGALVAAHFADRMVADHLIFFGLNPFADDPEKAQSRHDLATGARRLGGATALRMRRPNVFGPAPVKTRDEIYQMADQTTDMINAQTQLALTRPGALPALVDAKIPVLSLTGSRDQTTTPSQGMAAAKAARHGHFQNLDGLGHYALLEDPQACAHAVLRLIGIPQAAF